MAHDRHDYLLRELFAHLNSLGYPSTTPLSELIVMFSDLGHASAAKRIGASPAVASQPSASNTNPQASPAPFARANVSGSSRRTDSRGRSLQSDISRRTYNPRGALTTLPDDLKKIRGIGVLIEKKLNSLGVSHFKRIASFTKDDVRKLEDVIDIKGRIEREQWIEQATLLCNGGSTVHSRKVERESEEMRERHEARLERVVLSENVCRND